MATRNPTTDPGIEAKVAFLRRPESYGDPALAVEVVETHMSWVFLVGDRAYKLKKPVRHSYLDFSSLAARRRDCSEEICLNRRLAPGVYLGKLPLAVPPGGGLALGGAGTVVDWLVAMRRLARGDMLDIRLRDRTLEPHQLADLATVLARFYHRAAPAPWSPTAYRRRLRQGVENNAAALLLPRYGLPAERVRAVLAAQREFLAAQGRLLELRVLAERVVDGHGDLRPEHISLDGQPVVIDCLEFDRDLRLIDAADELAFLALECERLGSEEAGRRLLEFYGRCAGDTPPQELVAFYKSCRACLRAKLALWHLEEAKVQDPGKWLAQARDYLDLAEKYACLSRPAGR